MKLIVTIELFEDDSGGAGSCEMFLLIVKRYMSSLELVRFCVCTVLLQNTLTLQWDN